MRHRAAVPTPPASAVTQDIPRGHQNWDAKHCLHLIATKPCTCDRVQRIVVFQAVRLAERVAVLRTDSWQTGQQPLKAGNSLRNQDLLGFEF